MFFTVSHFLLAHLWGAQRQEVVHLRGVAVLNQVPSYHASLREPNQVEFGFAEDWMGFDYLTKLLGQAFHGVED